MRLKTRLITAATVAVTAIAIGVAMAATGGSEPKKAWAIDNIDINPGNVPTTAANFTQECDENSGGGPFPGQDVWVFVLPGGWQTTGDFVSITAEFQGQAPITITAAGDPDNFSNGGPDTSKGWIITPAGWTLIDAHAVITGEAEFFNLTHTCPGTTASPSPSPSMTPSPSMSPSMTPSPSMSPSMSPSVTPSPSRTRSPRPSPSNGYGY